MDSFTSNRTGQRGSLLVPAFVALGVAAVLALLLWRSYLTPPLPVARAVRDDLPRVVGAPDEIVPVATAPMSAAALTDAASVLPARRDPGLVEVCGAGYLPSNAEHKPILGARLEAAAEAARNQVIAALRASPEARQRALGLTLQRRADVGAAMDSAVQEFEAACMGDKSCTEEKSSKIFQGVDKVGVQVTDSLAQMASSSRDPVVYAMAVEACRPINPSHASTLPVSCQMISADQWVRVDPDNAGAWLHVARAAIRRKDPQALDDAMYHYASAKPRRADDEAVYSLAEAAIPVGASAFDRAQLSGTIGGLAMATMPLPWRTLTGYCSDAELGKGNRSATCEAVAQRLVNSGSTFEERRLGVRLGERLHWSSETLAQLREENDALQRAYESAIDDSEPASCRAVEKVHELRSQTARLGQVDAARREIAVSGKTVAALAAETRLARAALITAAASQRDLARSSVAAASGPAY